MRSSRKSRKSRKSKKTSRRSRKSKRISRKSRKSKRTSRRSRKSKKSLKYCDSSLECAKKYGTVYKLTTRNIKKLKSNVWYPALSGQTYFSLPIKKSNIMWIRWLTKDSDNIDVIQFSDYGEESYDFINQYGDELCTGSGCDPIWIIKKANIELPNTKPNKFWSP